MAQAAAEPLAPVGGEVAAVVAAVAAVAPVATAERGLVLAPFGPVALGAWAAWGVGPERAMIRGAGPANAMEEEEAAQARIPGLPCWQGEEAAVGRAGDWSGKKVAEERGEPQRLETGAVAAPWGASPSEAQGKGGASLAPDQVEGQGVRHPEAAAARAPRDGPRLVNPLWPSRIPRRRPLLLPRASRSTCRNEPRSHLQSSRTGCPYSWISTGGTYHLRG